MYERNVSYIKDHLFAYILGFSAVAALILLEMAAADQPLNSLSLSEEEVRVAAENYAIAALSMG